MIDIYRLLICFPLLVGFGSLLSASESPLLSAPRATAKVAAEPVPSADRPDLLVGLRKVGLFVGNGIYTSQLSFQQRISRVLTPATTTTYYRIQNDSQGLPALPYSLFTVSGTKSNLGLVVSYFNDLGGNITADVARGVHVLNIATGAESSLRQRATPRGSAKFVLLRLGARNSANLQKDVAGVLLQRP